MKMFALDWWTFNQLDCKQLQLLWMLKEIDPTNSNAATMNAASTSKNIACLQSMANRDPQFAKKALIATERHKFVDYIYELFLNNSSNGANTYVTHLVSNANEKPQTEIDEIICLPSQTQHILNSSSARSAITDEANSINKMHPVQFSSSVAGIQSTAMLASATSTRQLQSQKLEQPQISLPKPISPKTRLRIERNKQRALEKQARRATLRQQTTFSCLPKTSHAETTDAIEQSAVHSCAAQQDLFKGMPAKSHISPTVSKPLNSMQRPFSSTDKEIDKQQFSSKMSSTATAFSNQTFGREFGLTTNVNKTAFERGQQKNEKKYIATNTCSQMSPIDRDEKRRTPLSAVKLGGLNSGFNFNSPQKIRRLATDTKIVTFAALSSRQQ